MSGRKEALPDIGRLEPALDGDEIVTQLFMGDEEAAETIRAIVPEGEAVSSWVEVAEYLSFKDDASRQLFPGLVDRFDLEAILNKEEDK